MRARKHKRNSGVLRRSTQYSAAHSARSISSLVHREVVVHVDAAQVELQRTRTPSWPDALARFLVFLGICGFGRFVENICTLSDF